MLKPQDNQDAYKSTSILPRANNLKDVDYLLIHGTGDGKPCSASAMLEVGLVGVV